MPSISEVTENSLSANLQGKSKPRNCFRMSGGAVIPAGYFAITGGVQSAMPSASDCILKST